MAIGNLPAARLFFFPECGEPLPTAGVRKGWCGGGRGWWGPGGGGECWLRGADGLPGTDAGWDHSSHCGSNPLPLNPHQPQPAAVRSHPGRARIRVLEIQMLLD